MNGDNSFHKYKWQASNDGKKWVDLTEEDTKYASGRVGYITHIVDLEELGTAGTYQYYRLYYTAGQIGASYGTAIGEIELRFD